MDIIVGVISSIIAVIVIALVSYAYRSRFLYFLLNRFVEILTHFFIFNKQDSPVDSTVERATLLRRLRRSQSRSGIHYGQFGRETNLPELMKFHTISENLNVKPRMYLTMWPSIVLSKHNLESGMLTTTAKGIERLFHHYRIYVYQSASVAASPVSQPYLVSYRHTMCGALILYYLKNYTIVRGVTDLMMDNRNNWQNNDGGWAQCDREYTASDLWSSAYAIHLLNHIKLDAVTFSDSERSLASEYLLQTVKYFKSCWEQNKWSYGNVHSPENTVVLLIELAPILFEVCRTFLCSIITYLKQWLSPSGNLSESYLNACSDLPHSVHCARMSYALYLAHQPVELWYPLYLHALQNLDKKLNSADMSFLIDLSYAT